MIVTPFMYKMPRRLSTIIFQVLTIFGAALLFFLSLMENTGKVKLMKTIVSTCILTVVNAGQFPFFYAGLSELFPTRVRGTSNALILFLCKMMGSFAPFLSSFAQNRGYHIMVGCSALTILALPLTFLQVETLQEDENKSSESDGVDAYAKVEDFDRNSWFGSLVMNKRNASSQSEASENEKTL